MGGGGQYVDVTLDEAVSWRSKHAEMYMSRVTRCTQACGFASAWRNSKASSPSPASSLGQRPGPCDTATGRLALSLPAQSAGTAEGTRKATGSRTALIGHS